jgi:hypothetical protein
MTAPLRRSLVLGVAAIAAPLLFTGACRGSGARAPVDAGGAAVAGGSGSARVTYRPNVVVVEREEGLDALADVSRDGSTLVFESADPKWRRLEAGSVLLIEGWLARKVLAVDVDGSQVGVLTEPAALGDIAADAHIRLDAPVRFTASHAGGIESPFLVAWKELATLASPTVYAQAPDAERARKAEADGRADAAKKLASGSVSGIFSGWETTYSAVPAAGRLNLSLQMTKKLSGFVAQINGEGYLADFDLASDIAVERGIVERLQLTHKKINGVMNVTWVVAKESPGPLNLDDRVKLPAAISIPLHQFLGGFPLYLEISSAVIIKPAITGGKEYSRGAFRITYDGYQSFTAREGTIDSEGNVTGEVHVLESQGISAAAPLGMVLAMAAPRIELSVGVSKVLKFDDLQEAAGNADKIAELLITRVFGKDAYEKFKSSPAGGLAPGKIVGAAMGSDAAGYLELVTTSGMSASGMSAFTPCTRTDLNFLVRVGASAQAFGKEVAKVSEEIFRKQVSRVNPPGVKLCDGIG